MLVNRSVRKFAALVLASGAVAAGAMTRALALGAGTGARPVSAAISNRGNPNGLPPILRPATRWELAAIRSAEARESARFHYPLPATARYSTAVFNGYATEGR
jgi:hypothetical protein